MPFPPRSVMSPMQGEPIESSKPRKPNAGVGNATLPVDRHRYVPLRRLYGKPN